MTQDKAKGIILRLSDYLDADKLASIFTLEYGVVTAKFTGVKKEKAKLKAVARPFVFADFVLTKTGNNRVVSSASVIDSFYLTLSNYQKTMMSYIIVDTIKTILPNEKPEPDLFVLVVNALKKIEQQNELVATLDFLLKFTAFSGMEVQFPETEYAYFDNFTGNFFKTRENGYTAIDKKVYLTLKAINEDVEFDYNENVLKQCLRLMHNIIYSKFNEDIKSFQFV